MALQALSHIMDASMEDLARCPGIGERKVLSSIHREPSQIMGFNFLCDVLQLILFLCLWLI